MITFINVKVYLYIYVSMKRINGVNQSAFVDEVNKVRPYKDYKPRFFP